MDVDLREYLDERFGRVHDRFDAVDHRFDAMDKRVDDLHGRVDRTDGRIATVGALSGAAGTGVGFLLAWLEAKTGIGSWIRKG